jgi:hypothetical protein
MTETITRAIVLFLTGKQFPSRALRDKDMGHWFFQNSLYGTHPHLETAFKLRLPIIGIGAPARIFLAPVADKLHTDLILPQHHEVANALGAVSGTVMFSEDVLVYPRLSMEGMEILGYYVQNSQERHVFEQVGDAITHARDMARERALDGAVRSGAVKPQVVIDEQADGLDTYRIQAKAMGNPRLMK